MLTRRLGLQATALVPIALTLTRTPVAAAPSDGIVRVKSAHRMPETIARPKTDLAAKGILFFSEIDQAALAREAGIDLLPLDAARLRQLAAEHALPDLRP